MTRLVAQKDRPARQRRGWPGRVEVVKEPARKTKPGPAWAPKATTGSQGVTTVNANARASVDRRPGVRESHFPRNPNR